MSTVVRDWAREAAVEIDALCSPLCATNVNDKIDIIREHCPFKWDTAYMEVGADARALVAPLLQLLRASKRDYHAHVNCDRIEIGKACSCGADEWNADADSWNAEVDAVLAGHLPTPTLDLTKSAFSGMPTQAILDAMQIGSSFAIKVPLGGGKSATFTMLVRERSDA